MNKKWLKNIIRSEEEKRLDHLELDLLFEKYLLLVIRSFLKYENYYLAEKAINMREHINFLNKLTAEERKKRLSPSGEIGGIMFVGINPSERSKLGDVWEDPFGQYFGKMLTEAGIDKEKVWMSNVYKKQTEGNRPLNFEEIDEGVKELESEIQYVDPKIIVTLGRQPAEIFELYFPAIETIHLHHPAYIQRSPSPGIRSKYLLELSKLKKYE